MIKKVLSTTVVILALSAGAALSQDKGGKGGGGGRGPQGPGLTLTSPDIEDGAVIPDKFTMKAGANTVSPRLQWANVPMGTESFTLLLHDPDVSMQKKMDDVTHWMVFNIPGTARELPGGISTDAKLADGTIQIKNTANRVGYLGPGAPAAGPYHHYTFELFALDTKLDLTEAATRADVVKAMEGHILAKAVLAGRFHQ
jgi:Raf kinase inhibitor-like YbhB/YbcL family protein